MVEGLEIAEEIEVAEAATEIETVSVEDLPKNVQESYKNYSEYTNKKGKSPWNNNAGPKPGRAGKRYYNSDGKLPDGNYKEYDVNAQTGQTRDGQRFLRNEETGEVYYTADHYDTFLKIGE